jgi:hypothetical protein
MTSIFHDSAQLDISDRAVTLVAFARTYTQMIDGLSAYHQMSEKVAQDRLNQSIAVHAHPLLDTGTVAELFAELRTAIGAQDNWNTYGYLPDHLDGVFPDGSSTEAIEQALQTDIDLALFPLLTGLSTVHACTECQRVKYDVTTWNAVERGSRRCSAHRLVLAGQR